MYVFSRSSALSPTFTSNTRLPASCFGSYLKLTPETWGNFPCGAGASATPYSKAASKSAPVISIFIMVFPKGKAVQIWVMSIFPAGMDSRMPPPLVMAMSDFAASRMASATMLPKLVSCARTCSLTPSNSTAVVPTSRSNLVLFASYMSSSFFAMSLFSSIFSKNAASRRTAVLEITSLPRKVMLISPKFFR